MKTYARWLFGSAAAFNLAVGAMILFGRPLAGPVLGMEPATGANLVIINLAGVLVALFGAAYAMVATDPIRYRPFIVLSAAGKAAAFVCVLVSWLAGEVPNTMPMLAVGDLVYAVLFLDFVRRSRGHEKI